MYMPNLRKVGPNMIEIQFLKFKFEALYFLQEELLAKITSKF